MPKTLLIDPVEVRRPGVIVAPNIPINQYTPDPQAEAKTYGRDALVRIYRDMVLIREFETMLDRIKKEASTRASSTATKAPPTCPSARKPPPLARPSISLATTSSSVRIAATARFSPRASRPSPG